MDVQELSLQELEAALAVKKKEEREKKAMKKAVYEQDRDRLVENLLSRAKVLHNQMRDYKQYCMEQLEKFRGEALEYGDIRSNSKGGFSLRHEKSQDMVVLERNSIPEYDERAQMAESLIKEFLEDTVKKKDLQTYKTIAALLERNKKGDYTPGRVASLLKIKDNYSDPRWVKAMELYEEGFRIREISYSVSFYTKDQMGKDKALVLTFASIPVNFLKPEEKENDETEKL